ncbi:MAG: hypothetical protein IIT59_01975, partial [Rhodocyclaceae bacterium]|nr:hypothetical protein [Rhodocyclaceae bacterium]
MVRTRPRTGFPACAGGQPVCAAQTPSLVNEHVAIDLISVSEKLRNQGNLEAVGGPVFLADLSQNIGAAAHIEFYLKI